MITFLTMMISVKMVTKVNPVLASTDGWIRFFVGHEHEPFSMYPTQDMWTPPAWYTAQSDSDLWVLQELNKESSRTDGPRIMSRSAFVFDLDSGEVLYSKNPDTRWPVASLTKVVSALTLASLGGDLEESICLDRTVYANWPGARTYFDAGECVTGWDLLGSALVRSDNGGAFGLSRIANIPHGVFVEQMNVTAGDLSMDSSEFVDPAGVKDENLSTARDITKAIVAASRHPVISMAASAPHWNTQINEKGKRLRLNTTNRFINRGEFLAAKTGYTYTAHNCFSAVVHKNGRNLAITTLGALRSKHRWEDIDKLLRWSVRN